MVGWFISREHLAHSDGALLLLKMSPLGEQHTGKFILSKEAVNTTYNLLLKGFGSLFTMGAYFKHGYMIHMFYFYFLPCNQIK
jgi:hypothetical protein